MTVAEKYCAYCRLHRPDQGFKLVFHSSSNTRRAMCPPCQDIRKRPRSELRELAEQERQARKTKR